MTSPRLQCEPGFVVDHIKEWTRLPHMYIATHDGANASNQFTGDIYIKTQNVEKLGRFLVSYNAELYPLFNAIVNTPSFKRFTQDDKITREEINTIPETLPETRNSADQITRAANPHYRADIITNYNLIAGLAALFAESDCAVLPSETTMGKIKDNAPWLTGGAVVGLAAGLVVGFRKPQSGGEASTPAPARTRTPAPEEIPTTAFGRWRERMKIRGEMHEMYGLHARTSRRPDLLQNLPNTSSPYISERAARGRTRQLRQRWHALGGDRNSLNRYEFLFKFLDDAVVNPIIFCITSSALTGIIYSMARDFYPYQSTPPANRPRR